MPPHMSAIASRGLVVLSASAPKQTLIALNLPLDFRSDWSVHAVSRRRMSRRNIGGHTPLRPIRNPRPMPRLRPAFSGACASFVSVTQAFNTTSSMGRLTLNVLLSFAQFEREVTAERIRDKVAASKAKGMWMGGTLPLGYDAQDRSLIVNQPEAERVRFIFARYLELGSIQKLAEDLDQRGLRSKGWVSRTGRVHESQRIYPGALAAILSNPIYRGLIAHRGKTYPGRHDAIVDEATWEAVQTLRSAIKSPNSALPERIDCALLKGRAFDDAGSAMRVVFTRKGERRYRYYGSAAHLDGKGTPGSLTRVSVGALDRTVIEATAAMLCDRWRAHEPKQARVLAALRQVEVSAQKLRFLLAAEAIAPALQGESGVERVGDAFWLTRPIVLARPHNATTIVGAAPPGARTDRTLVRAIALARAWADKLESGAVRSVVDLAAAEKRCLHYTNKLLPLAYLAPDLIEMILDGRQPHALTLSTLLAKTLPLDWVAQRAWLRALA